MTVDRPDGNLRNSDEDRNADLPIQTDGRPGERPEEELRRHREAFRESQERLRRAQAIGHLGSWELDLSKGRLIWSDEVYRIFGLEPQEFGETYAAFLEAVHPEDRAAVDAAYSTSLRDALDGYEIEHRIVRKPSGEIRFVHEKCEHIRDAEGRILKSIGMVQDITDRKRFEEEVRRTADLLRDALAESEDRGRLLDAMMEHIPLGITLADAPDVRIRRVSRFGRDLIEKTAEELTGLPTEQHWSAWQIYRADGVTPATPEELPLTRATMNGELVQGEVWFVTRKDGTRIPVLCTAAPIRDRNGHITGGVVGWQDISDRKKNEEQVRRLNETLHARNAELEAERMRWQGVVEGIAEEVWICDEQGRMSLINLPDATEMGLDEFEGRSVHEVLDDVEILYPDGRPRPPEEAPLLVSLRTGKVIRGEEIMRHRLTGKTRIRQYSCAPTRDAEGRITGAVAIARDVTESRETEKALREADRRKNEFLAMLSHELRNPLAPIQTSLYLLERYAPDGDEARAARAIIGRQVDHLTHLVGGLLDVSRITRGKIQLKCRHLDLAEVVTRTVEDHVPLFNERGVRLEFAGPDGPLWINGDGTRLAQVVGNLLQNAAKFTPEGGAAFVSLKAESGSAVLQVRDTGVGIAPEVMARIFEPFTQADRSLDRSSGGLGLGLSLVKGLVELHAGKVQAESGWPGGGTSMTVHLPLESARPGTEQPSGHAARNPRRVLVIEDNPDAARSLKLVLEFKGHIVSVAFSGKQALEQARTFSPEVVLCDIGLPEMDGYQVARALRSDSATRDVVLIALTGYASAEDHRDAMKAGFDHHMAKPADLEALDRILAGARDAA